MYGITQVCLFGANQISVTIGHRKPFENEYVDIRHDISDRNQLFEEAIKLALHYLNTEPTAEETA